MLGRRMTLKTPILAFLLLGIGYVVGLPLGKMNADSAANESEVSDGSGPSDHSQPATATRASKKPQTSATATTLTDQLCALHEREKGGSFLADWSTFDATAAEWLNARSTAELSALAIQLSQTKKSTVPDEVLRAVFMHWARRDAGAAWQAALGALPDHRADALAACLLALSASDHIAALKRVESIVDESLRKEAKKVLNQNADRFWQPESLARRLAAMAASERPKDLLNKTIQSWASHHLRSALDFVKSLPQTDREEPLGDFCQVLAYFDASEAERLAGTIQDPKLAANAWKGIVMAYEEVNPDLAATVMESLPLEQMDPKFFDHRSNSGFSADVAGRIAARLTGKSREHFLQQVFANSYLITSHQLQSLLNAIELQPEDGKAMSRVVERMMHFTPDSALSWAQSLPESPLRDHVFAKASTSIRDNGGDRLQAIQMAADVQDEALRTKTLRSNIEDWLQNDRKAALAWLKSANGNLLPAEESARWLRLNGAK